MRLSPHAARVLGCLVEKARTTPDQYPLSLNALVTASNQTTNRWPVVRYDEGTVEVALDELRALDLIRREKPHGGRAIKYSELMGRALVIDEPAIALLAVLMLRGPQTPGELKARTERLHTFADLGAVDDTLRALATHEDGPFVEQLAREPGRKESRWRDLLQESARDDVDRTPVAGVATVTAAPGGRDLVDRVSALEAEVARLGARLDGLAAEPRQ
jgi:uncharacterized protein YceH (UPF0502 family)